MGPSVADLLYVFTPRPSTTTNTTTPTTPNNHHATMSLQGGQQRPRQRPPSTSSSTYDTWGRVEGDNSNNTNNNTSTNSNNIVVDPSSPRVPVRYVRQGEYDPEYDPRYHALHHPHQRRQQQQQQEQNYHHDQDDHYHRNDDHHQRWGSTMHAPSEYHHNHDTPPFHHIKKEALDSSQSTSEVTPPSAGGGGSEEKSSSVQSSLTSSVRRHFDDDDEKDRQNKRPPKLADPSHAPKSAVAAAREAALLDSFRQPAPLSQRRLRGNQQEEEEPMSLSLSLSSYSASQQQQQLQQPSLKSNQQQQQQQMQAPQVQQQQMQLQRQLVSLEHYNNNSKNNDDGNMDDVNKSSSLEESNYTHSMSLHDLCGEATRTDDIAWRNALYLLSIQPQLAQTVTDEEKWTPLHVSCLGVTPPPDFMVRALLYCDKTAACAVDAGGRLPLHILAASSADPTILAMLVNEHAPSIYQRDETKHGFTPLHLLLRNEDVIVTVEQVRILLGQCIPPPPSAKASLGRRRILQRRCEHLDLTLEDLERIGVATTPRDQRERKSLQEQWQSYPDDVQVCFKRLEQWNKKHNKKKKKKPLQQQNDDDDEEEEIVEDSVEVEWKSSHEEHNPAAMATLTHQQLPLHIMVRRVLHPPNHNNAGRSNYNFTQADEETEVEDEPYVLDRYLPPSGNVHEVLRVLVAAYPQALVTRDGQGRTPLLLALLDRERQADLEIMELLLGRSCSNTTFQTSLPEWAFDLTFPNQHHHSAAAATTLTDGTSPFRFINPAMVATVDTLQLPLHVAAEEMIGHVDVISSIYACYPGAIYVQDARGRTPLHIALSNYRRILPPSRVISLLFTDRVARIRDFDGKLPFDLLVEAGPTLSRLPSPRQGIMHDDEMDLSIYGKLLAASVTPSPHPYNRTPRSMAGVMFLDQLRKLPPWLRRQACRADFTQELIMEDMSSPFKCAGILFYGFVLCLLVTAFRLQLHDFQDHRQGGRRLASLIYAMASYLILCQVVEWIAFISCSEYRRLLSLGCWMTMSAATLTVITTYEMSLPYNKSFQDYQDIASLASAATAILWACVLWYLSSWWYGMAVFMGIAKKTAFWMLWPVIALGILVVGLAQVLYTHYSPDCKHGQATTVPFLCNARDAYGTVYYLMLGQSLEESSHGDLSTGTIVLVVMFTFVAVWIIVSALASLIIIVGRLDPTEIALTSFWEPKLSWLLVSRSNLLRNAAQQCCCRRKLLLQETGWPSSPKMKLVIKPSLIERYCNLMAYTWEQVADIEVISGSKRSTREQRWYSQCRVQLPYFMGVVSLIVVPLWLLFGFVTFGLLWPPQIRRWLFQPRVSRGHQVGLAFGNAAVQVTDVRNELRHLKNMTFEKTTTVHQEIRELKDLLLRAMSE